MTEEEESDSAESALERANVCRLPSQKRALSKLWRCLHGYLGLPPASRARREI